MGGSWSTMIDVSPDSEPCLYSKIFVTLNAPQRHGTLKDMAESDNPIVLNRRQRRAQAAKERHDRNLRARIRLDETLMDLRSIVDTHHSCDMEGCEEPWIYVTHASLRGDKSAPRKVVARRCFEHRTEKMRSDAKALAEKAVEL